MSPLGKHLVSKRVIAFEIVAFATIIILIWFNELFDIPFLFLGADATPINWRESLFESIIIIILGTVIIHFTNSLFQRMKYLEGILPVCASCKKIRDGNNRWQEIESYIRERSDADFSHGICPECAEKLYPDFNSK